jgi:hypothetical protein
MTEREQIVYLRTALKNLAQSADRYIEDGSWVEHLSLDIEFAKGILKTTKTQKEQIK